METKQVFYDKNKRRWRYSKTIMLAWAVLFLIVFGVTSYTLAVQPKFNNLDLGDPQAGFRGVPNVNKANGEYQNPPAQDDVLQGQDSQGVTQASQQQSQTGSVPGAPLVLGESSSAESAKVFSYYVNWDENSFQSLKSNLSKIDGLYVEWLHLGDDGAVLEDDSAKQTMARDYIKQNRPDLPLTILINNYNSETQQWDSDRLVKILELPYYRNKAVDNISSYIIDNKYAGLSVDFENIPDQLQPSYLLFMQAVYQKLQPLGIEVSVNIPLDDPAFDAKALSDFADHLILMAYDQNTIYNGGFAGPIASKDWYLNGLAYRFSQIPSQKYIISIGGYGYDWDQTNPAKNSELSFQDVIRLARSSNADVAVDQLSLNPSFDYYDQVGDLHHVWYLDAVTAFNEIQQGNRLGDPFGYVFWRMGSEDPTVWKVFEGRGKLDEQLVRSITDLKYGFEVAYEGQGEILKVTANNQDGLRKLVFDRQSDLIVDERMVSYPSPYIITRWGGEDANSKKIALTFDDGPDAKYTPKILDILKQNNAPAAFFVIGLNANLNPQILKRTAAEGHEIGNHTYSHPNVSAISAKQFNLELGSDERLFEGLLGVKSLLFRPPYAEDVEPTTSDQIKPLVDMSQLGYYTVSMNIDPYDWSKPGTDQIVQRVIDGATSNQGNVVLLHDGGGDRSETVEALPKIIEGLRANGFELVSLSDLISQPKESVMPKLSAQERVMAYFNGAAFLSIAWLSVFIRWMFLVGIGLGLLRFAFVGFLAIIQARSKGKNHFSSVNLPKVGVVIPAYNEENVIIRTVEAVLNSNYRDLEVVIVDDGSEDSTYRNCLLTFGDDPRVKIFSKANAGKSEALNFGIERTDALIIVTLDADTIFLPDTIARLVQKFSDPRVVAVAGNAKVGNRINLLTKWQALEYITSQNLDRRAFEMINSISVVPGAVGAWRKEAVLKAGGFSDDTLAEDADLTFSIIRAGGRVAYEDSAVAYTEAPDNIKSFLKQRFRWMYGTLQTAWKHRVVFFKNKSRGLGWFGIPNVFIFQIFFPLISPLMDLVMIFSIGWALFQWKNHPLDYSVSHSLFRIVIFYLLFTLVDLLTAIIPFFLEKGEDWKLILWLPLQRFFYRQLMYFVAIKSVFMAIKGKLIGWNKFERKATVIDPVTVKILKE